MQKENPAGFLNFLHSFRGFAIISIVSGHAVSALYITAYHKYNWSDPILYINEILFNQCTLYFALISGLLFSAVLKERSYTKFYKNKILFVFLPYLFFTIFYSFVKFKRYNLIYIDQIDQVLNNLFANLLFGGGNFVLWYIPVLFGLYILTPLFSFLLRHKKQTNVILWLIILIPLISSCIKFQIMYEFIVIKIIYFSGAYVLGMYLGENIESSLNWVKLYLFQILFIVFVSSILLFYLHYYNIHKYGRINILEAVYYIQKIFLAGVILVLFKNLGQLQPLWLSKVAVDSTPIYFIHGAIVYSCASLFLFIHVDKTYALLTIFSGAIALTVFTIIVSMLISALIKKIFGKTSRFIMGA